MGSPNYIDEDINFLLDIVESCERIGGNDWAQVSKMVNIQASQKERPFRDDDSLCIKFDNLTKATKLDRRPFLSSKCTKSDTHSENNLGIVNEISVGGEEFISDISPVDNLSGLSSDSESQLTPPKRNKLKK